MKKLMKVLCLVLVLMVVVAPVASFANDFSNLANSATDTIGLTNTVNTLGGSFYQVLKTVALFVALCMIVYMAIQWLMATPSKKAELKGRMWSMLIGVILLVAGATILDLVGNLGQNVVDTVDISGATNSGR